MQYQQFAQKAFVCRGDTVLLVQKSQDDPHNPGRWELPGGRMNFGEDVDAHLVREVLEETGVTVVPGAPVHIWQWVMSDINPGSSDEIQVIAVARQCDASVVPDSETQHEDTDFISQHEWVKIDDLRALDLIPSLRPAVDAFISRRLGS